MMIGSSVRAVVNVVIKISANNQKTADEITMPANPKNLKCNDTLLAEAELNLLSDSDSVKFSWDCDSYSYFNYRWDDNSTDIEATTKNPHVAFATDGGMYYTFNLLAIEGPCLGREIKKPTKLIIRLSLLASGVNSEMVILFNLTSLTPGTCPNVKGDCGDGYVLGFSEELEYNIWTGGAKLMKSNKELRIKDMIKQQLLEIVMNGDNIDIE
ncbi:MAG: hypothetical protein ACFFDN_38520 [Candidatus Hodarchaeota archaeon]